MVMQTYQYRCPLCGLFEVKARFGLAKSTELCPMCRTTSPRVFSIPQIRFVGVGWTTKDKSHEFEQRFPDLAKKASVGD